MGSRLPFSAVPFCATALFMLLVVAGCNQGPTKPEGVSVSGKVLLPNGAPLSGGMLTLRPESGVYGATAPIQSDGSFTLQDGGKTSVVRGQYQVYVRFSDNDPPHLKSAVNQRYQQRLAERTVNRRGSSFRNAV
jgi:hypothetical protein